MRSWELLLPSDSMKRFDVGNSKQVHEIAYQNQFAVGNPQKCCMDIACKVRTFQMSIQPLFCANTNSNDCSSKVHQALHDLTSWALSKRWKCTRYTLLRLIALLPARRDRSEFGVELHPGLPIE